MLKARLTIKGFIVKIQGYIFKGSRLLTKIVKYDSSLELINQRVDTTGTCSRFTIGECPVLMQIYHFEYEIWLFT